MHSYGSEVPCSWNKILTFKVDEKNTINRLHVQKELINDKIISQHLAKKNILSPQIILKYKYIWDAMTI